MKNENGAMLKQVQHDKCENILVNTIEQVRAKIAQWKSQGLTVGLVPTMGALHQGHLSLIEKSVEKCDKTVVSIFVNPTQFGPSEDFDKYPRTLENDLNICQKAAADLVFAPSAIEMYGQGNILSNDFLTYVIPPYFYVDKLCAKNRVGHFDGVCTVVSKLFNIVTPDFAFFGQKDAQQLIIIKKMVKDLNIPAQVEECPIVREESGLALSSRNKYLTDEQKQEALVLSKILNNIKSCYQKGVNNIEALSETALQHIAPSLLGFVPEAICENSKKIASSPAASRNDVSIEMEYLEFVDKNTLEEKTVADDNTLVLIAIKIGGVRLIDNIKLGNK